jgi:hypothetical protein
MRERALDTRRVSGARSLAVRDSLPGATSIPDFEKLPRPGQVALEAGLAQCAPDHAVALAESMACRSHCSGGIPDAPSAER